jgi:UDP-glucose 4-epimerase
MKIVVTGAAGFIGSNTANSFVNEHEVIGIDNLFLGNKRNLDRRIMFIEKNVGEINNLDLKNVDAVFHFGNPSSSPMFEEDLKSWKIVIDDFIEVVRFVKQNAARLVFASSSSIYGPMTQYKSSRLAMENIAQSIDLNYAGMRYFSVYGANEKHKKKFANCLTQFLWEMKNDKQPLVYGDGSQTRDFIFVKDVVESNKIAIMSDVRGIFDIGTGKGTSFNEIIELLNKSLGKNIEPKYVDNPIKHYVKHTKADPSHAKKNLRFESKTQLEDGIKELVKVYRS